MHTIVNTTASRALALGVAIVLVMGLAGCANPASDPSRSLPSGVPSTSAVPRLEIELRCGACMLSDQHKAAIREAFEQQYRSSNTKACARDRITLTIDELNQQSFALLMILGPGALLLSDKAKGTIQTCAGASAIIEGAVRRPPPFRTTNALMADLGAQAARALAP
jgi:hypothetical protein